MDKSSESNPTTNKNSPGEQDTNSIPNHLHINTIPEFISTPTNPIRVGSVLHTFLENNDPSCQRPCCVFPMDPVSLKQNNTKNTPIPASKIPTVRKFVNRNNSSRISKGRISYKQISNNSNAPTNATGLNTQNINANLETKKLPVIVPVIPEKQIVQLYSKAIRETKVVSPRISNCSSTASCNRPSMIPVKIKSESSRNEKNQTGQEKPRKTGYDPKKTLKKVDAEKNPVRKNCIREIFGKNASRIPVRVSSRYEGNLKAGTLSKPENSKIETILFPDVISNSISNNCSMTYISLPEVKETQQFDVHDLDTMSFQDAAAKILSLCPDMISNGVVTLPGRKERHTAGHTIENCQVSINKNNEIQEDAEEKLIEYKDEENTKCDNKIIINQTRESGVTDNLSDVDVVAIVAKISSTTRLRTNLKEISVDVDESPRIIFESEKKENKKESELLNEELVADSPTPTCTKDKILLPEVEQFAKAKKCYFSSTDEKIQEENKRNWLISSLHISLAAREGFIHETHKILKKGNRVLLGRYRKLFIIDKDKTEEHKNPSEKDLKEVLKSYSKFVFWLNDYYGKCLEDIRIFEKLELCKGTNSSKLYHETTMNIEGSKLSGIFIPVTQSTPTFNTDYITNDNIDGKECKIGKIGEDDSESSLKESCPPAEINKYEEVTCVEIKPVVQLHENNELISFENEENCNSDLKETGSQEFGIIDAETNKHEENEEVVCAEIKPVIQLSENKELISFESEENCTSDLKEQESQEFSSIEECIDNLQLESTLVSASSENNAVSRKRSSADIFTNCSNNMIRKKQRKNTKNRKRFPKTNLRKYSYSIRSEPSSGTSSQFQINIPWSTNVGDSINLRGFAIDEMVENLWRDIDMQALGMNFDVLNPIVEELEVLPGNNNANSFITDELDLPVNDSDDGNDFIAEEIVVNSSFVTNHGNAFIPEELQLQFENNDENSAVEEIEVPLLNTDEGNSLFVGNFETLFEFSRILHALQYWNNFSLLQDTYNCCNKDLILRQTQDFPNPHAQNEKQLLVNLPSNCSSLIEYGGESHDNLTNSSPKNNELCTKRNFSNNFSTSDNNSLTRIFPELKSDFRLTSFSTEKIFLIMSSANLFTLPLIQEISFSNYFFDFYKDIGNSNLHLSVYTCDSDNTDKANIDSELKTPDTFSTEIIPLHDSQEIKTKVRIVALEQFYEKDGNFERIVLVQDFSMRKVTPLKSKLIALENIPGNTFLSTSNETIGKQAALQTIEESSEEEENFHWTPRKERFPSYFNCDTEEVELLNEEHILALEEKKSQEENKCTNKNFTRAACFHEDLEINDFYSEEIIDTEPEESEKEPLILEQHISSIPKQDLSSMFPSNHEIDDSTLINSYDQVSYEYCSHELDLLIPPREENETTRNISQHSVQIKCATPISSESRNKPENSETLVEDQTFVNEIEISCPKSNSDRDLLSTIKNVSNSATKIQEAPSVNKEPSFTPQQPPVVSVPSSSSFLLITSESKKDIDPSPSDELHQHKQPVRIRTLRSFHSLPSIVDTNDILNDSPEFQCKSIPMLPQKLKPQLKPLSTSEFAKNSRCAANLAFPLPETPIPTTPIPVVIPSVAILYKKSASFTNCTEIHSLRKPTMRSDGKYNKFGWKLNRDSKTDFTEKLKQLSTLANNSDNLSHEKTPTKSRIPRFQPKTNP